MKQLSTFLTLPKPSKGPSNERSDIIKQILQSINSERVGTKYKPITAKHLAIRLSHLELTDLYYTHKAASNYSGPYSKYVFGALKVDKSVANNL